MNINDDTINYIVYWTATIICKSKIKQLEESLSVEVVDGTANSVIREVAKKCLSFKLQQMYQNDHILEINITGHQHQK